MTIEIIDHPITKAALTERAKKQFGDFIKAVVDIKREIMAIGGDLHADEETVLLDDGSVQENLWGINIFPERTDSWIEFDSMINVRPIQGNRTRSVENPETQKRIIAIVQKLISD